MSEATEVVERYFRSGMAGDRNGRVDLFTEDGVVEFPFAPEGMPRRFEGRAAIGEMFTTLGARADAAEMRIDEATSQFTLHETLDPSVVIAELDLRVKDMDLPLIQVFRITDGKIASFRDYWGPITAAFTKDALQAP